MAKQRYNTTGINDLSYYEGDTAYVAPPVKEIISLLDDRKEQYIQTKNNLNLATELRNSLPYNPASKGIYDELIANIDKATSSITPENYADKVLDSKQIVFDANNVMGGKQLKEQQTAVLADLKTIDDAKDISDAKKQWKAKQLQESIQSISKNDNGTFTVPTLTMPKLIPDPHLHDKVLKTFNGWKSSGMYVRDPRTGHIIVDKSIVGQNGITKTEFNDEKEIYDTIFNYVLNDPEARDFIDDEADFNTSNLDITPEKVLSTLPKESLIALFPNSFKKDINGNFNQLKQITPDDISKLTGNNPEYLKDIAKQGFKSKYVNSVARVGANTLGYTNDTMTLYEDIEESARIKAKYSDKTAKEEEIDLGDGVIPLPTTTMQIPNPTSYAMYDKLKEDGRQAYVNAKVEVERLTTQLNESKARGTSTPKSEKDATELINTAKENLAIADTRIQEATQAQYNITKGVMQLANDKKVPIIEQYKKDFNIIYKEVENGNKASAMGYGYSVDITKKNPDLKTNNKGFSTVTFDLEGDGKVESVPAYTEAQVKNYSPIGHYAIRKGNKVTLYYGAGSRTMIGNELNDKVIKSVGVDMLQDNPYRKEGNLGFRQALKYTPTEDDFTAAVSKYFLNPKENVENLTPHANMLAKEAAHKLRLQGKASDLKVNQTLDYLFVPTTIKKGTAAYNLLQTSRTIDNTLETNGAQYKVVNSNGEWEDLPLFLKSKGIPYESKYIDFAHTRSGIMLTSDRQYGQKIFLPLKLTEAGMELAKKVDPLLFDNAGTLNLHMVNKAGRTSALNLSIVQNVTNAYRELLSNNQPGSEATKAAYGLINFDNSENSKRFYDLNLYTLPSGDSATHILPNGEKLIINAIKKSSRPDKLGDNDFYLTDENGATFGYDVAAGVQRMIPQADYFADKTSSKYKRTLLASPEDIGSLIGQKFLYDAVTHNPTKQVVNNNIKTTGDSYTVKPNTVISAKHKQTVDNTVQEYGKDIRTYNITDVNGKIQKIRSIIDPNKMTDISSSEYLGKPSKNNNWLKAGVLPYFNNAVAGSAVKVIKRYGLHLTEAIRDAEKNDNNPNAAKDSLHKYGKSLDASYNVNAINLLKKLENDPELADEMGISYAFKHIINGKPHLHIDFK